MSDTIYALSSGTGRAAVAVIRLTGPRTRFVLETMAGGVTDARRASLRRLVDPATGDLLDEALVLFFPGPQSYSGEDLAELQVHGGRAVVQATLAALAAIPGCRLAEPGEFTRRALEHGRLDLARVEGLADLIAADTPHQRRQALAQAGGLLSGQVEAWRGILLEAMAELAAAIDFADEGDVQDKAAADRMLAPLQRLKQELAAALADGRRGEIVRDGFTVAIAGPPNAGKSTLLNALARRDVAIVSDIPGTTRDVLEVHLDLGGYPVVLLDTAGIRDTTDLVEGIGIDRAVSAMQRADLVLWLRPADWPAEAPPDGQAPVIEVVTKIDSCPNGDRPDLRISALTGEGLPVLLAIIEKQAAASLGSEPALVTQERHRLALERTLEFLDSALAAVESDLGPEMAAEDLRLAARALGAIIGIVDVEHVLDRVFSSFCIGK